LRGNTWPGYALAGGVFIAAIVALLLLTGGNGPRNDTPPPTTADPGVTRLFPSAGGVAGATVRHHRKPSPASLTGTVGATALLPSATAPGSSAAESQYGAAGNRGTVLISP
jgi:hypothetical protein